MFLPPLNINGTPCVTLDMIRAFHGICMAAKFTEYHRGCTCIERNGVMLIYYIDYKSWAINLDRVSTA